jgi:hypothetical protein
MEQKPTKHRRAFSSELAMAKKLWPGQSSGIQLESFKKLWHEDEFSVRAGDLQLLEGRWYVTHSGLVRLSRRNNCSAIQVQPIPRFCDAPSRRWVFKATVYKSSVSKGFVGYGDAEPSNVSPVVRGAEMRVAETRAVNRALRKAYGIGICSVEELGFPRTAGAASEPIQNNQQCRNQNGSNNGQLRLRDRLRLLIRDHKLDPTLVKAYAADFCGTATLSGASRELVESFISHLATTSKENRDGLVCKLNSYVQPEAHP